MPGEPVYTLIDESTSIDSRATDDLIWIINIKIN